MRLIVIITVSLGSVTEVTEVERERNAEAVGIVADPPVEDVMLVPCILGAVKVKGTRLLGIEPAVVQLLIREVVIVHRVYPVGVLGVGGIGQRLYRSLIVRCLTESVAELDPVT